MSEDIHEAEFLESAPCSLAVVDPATFCLPAVSTDDAKAAMTRYLELCEAVLEESDYQTFTQKVKDPATKRWVATIKKFKKKSAVKKLQTFWGVSVAVRDTVRDDLGDGHFGFRCVARATGRDGRVVDATGGCSTHEERFAPAPYDDESPERYAARVQKTLARSYHDVLSTAETRATNRAVMNCIGVGGGEVTSDEMGASKGSPQTAPREPAKAQETHAAKPVPVVPKGRTVPEIALAAFGIAKALGVVPDDRVLFREYVRAHYAGELPGTLKPWGFILAALEEQVRAASYRRAGADPLAAATPAAAPSEQERWAHRKWELRVLAMCTERHIGEQARHEMGRRLFARESLCDLTETQLRAFVELLARGEAA